MIDEKFKEEVSTMYDVSKEVFAEHLAIVTHYMETRMETQELQGIEDEEMEEILPAAAKQKARLEAILAKFNDDATRNWFIELVLGRLNEGVTDEDAEILEKALAIQDRIEGILEESSSDLVGYLSKDVDQEVVIQ